MKLWGQPPPAVAPVILVKIRPVEVPVITEVKRRLGHGDVAGALLYAYPKLVDDLGRAFHIEIPPGYAHEEIVARSFTPDMAPLVDFFDRLYRLYAPVRYGGTPPADGSDEVLEVVRSLYGNDAMWRLYVKAPLAKPDRGRRPAEVPAPVSPDSAEDGERA